MRKTIPLLLAAGLFCACNHSPKPDAPLRSVVLTSPVRLEQTCVKTFSGIVREAHLINLGFKTAGQIEKIHVKEGDFVTQGQLLAELDDSDYRLGVEALQIQYNQIKDEVERTSRLFKQKSVSANDYEKARAGLKQLGIQLQVNKNKLAYTKLHAPTNGYISSVNFSPAEMVDAGTAMFSLMDVSRMEVAVDIPVDEYRECRRFTYYYCKAGNGRRYPMDFVSLAPKADGNQLYRLRLAFAEPPHGEFTAGLNVEVGIGVADSGAATGFALPPCALFEQQGDAFVWVLNADSTVSSRRVSFGRLDAEGRAVVNGLSGNERIVRAGVNVLREGEKVRVMPQQGETNVGGLL
ncbi:MAG: efflux RND transporter periplasmic adaptor subunit [Bacteroides sp.]|nr:efflux RND transporter periplasmic adaptor subunit [Bacteroides sp.]